MAVKAVGTWVAGFRQIGRSDLGCRRAVAGAAAGPNWTLEVSWARGRLECAGVCVKPVEDVKSVEDENLSSAPVSSEVDGGAENAGADEEPGKLNRDLPNGLLPKPLSLTDITVSSHGSNVRVAYQGCPGAFSEAAALKAYPRCVAVPCEQFEVAFKAVELWLVDKAVLPIENSVGGSIHRNYDLLLCHRLHIVGEVQMAVNHCLMTLPGVKKEQLKRVLSHPQALAQCEIALSKLGVIRENVDDTALAAQLVASNDLRDAGAVASAQAAEIYGLEILEERIQTSIVFTLEEGSGILFKALAVFSLRGINLTKIESRPQRKRPLRVVDDSNHGTAKYFDYLFYIDFEASMAETRAQNALAHLQEFATFLRVLGSYPMDTSS
ncbi:arogenate dehydratase/prephenate dehydratase 6, chloroplastic-like isoform X2 [Phoenix dactylifera]|uniref:Arogenate dehydratase/prephenate dehydratase 6, chloroplastic-like isoform X2 n=1 Tax=Phoenix dactylifera TaxID=42345 RepID=A0A8B7MXC9_PHODC|nr:arogenate dehydratase/prephenate dehydratase 6, chloroplastic-like isoform X2 [Phoenix dactylifera]